MTDLTEPFVAGLVAGYGVAIPVGAIGVLVVDAGMRGGFRPAAAAATGVATADFLYATLAAAAGTVIAELLAPWQHTVQLLAAVVLVAVAAIGFRGLWRRRATEDDGSRHAPSGRHMFVRFLALTSVNPATVAYFAALIAGLPAVASAPTEAKVAFVLAAGAASLSWQLVLGAAGATLHHKLPHAARLWTGVAGNALVLALAARMAMTA
jgi:threonine/homoserine/homoserine lactone efflux protein